MANIASFVWTMLVWCRYHDNCTVTLCIFFRWGFLGGVHYVAPFLTFASPPLLPVCFFPIRDAVLFRFAAAAGLLLHAGDAPGE